LPTARWRGQRRWSGRWGRWEVEVEDEVEDESGCAAQDEDEVENEDEYDANGQLTTHN
jgi:hypothetical protein